MTVITETVRITAAPVITLKGKGKAARELAYMQIAPLAMIDTLGRADMIANLAKALGNAPTEAELKTAQTETTIGRVAARLPAGEFPNDCKSDDAKLEFARKLVLHYAAPAQEGKAARKLRAGQLGRRSAIQHKVIRAADEAWSQIKAELGLGKAQTQQERNKAKRSTNTNPVRGDGKGKGTAPTHSELVSGSAPKTSDEAHAYIDSMAATLLAFGNKHAKLLCLDYANAIQTFKTSINKAANDRALRKAAKEAGAHNK